MNSSKSEFTNASNAYSSYLKKREYNTSSFAPSRGQNNFRNRRDNNNDQFVPRIAKSAKIEEMAWSDESNDENEKDAASAYSVNSSDSDMEMDFKEPSKRRGDSGSQSQTLSRREKLLNQLREAEEAVASSK